MKKLIVSVCLLLISALILLVLIYVKSLQTLLLLFLAGVVILAAVDCFVNESAKNLKFYVFSYIGPAIAFYCGWIDGPTQLILMPFLWLPLLLNFKLVRKIVPLMFLDINTLLVDGVFNRSTIIRYGLDIVNAESSGNTLLLLLLGVGCMMAIISVLFKKIPKHKHHHKHHHRNHNS